MSRHLQIRDRRRPRTVAAAAASIAPILALSLTVPSPISDTLPAAAAGHSTASCSEAASAKTAEPSGQRPPSPNSMPGYVLDYCTEFTGSQLPSGWGKFDGQPSGDPGARFDRSHVVVGSGLLSLLTLRDPAHGNNWATGGVCQCGLARTYGAYFVRSRVTGPGDDEDQLLWPAGPHWPPEVDFNETGAVTTKTAFYVHYGAGNHQVAKTLKVDLTKWHTWGVRWTPTTLTFTVDHVTWGTVKAAVAIPHEDMTLDIQQQTYCGIAAECPRKPVSMLVDWVSEFVPR